MSSLTRHRRFRLVWTGSTAETLGLTVATVALPLAATEAGASAAVVALLAAAAAAPALLFGLAGGWLVDHVPPRRVILTCDAVTALTLLTVALAAWTQALSMVHLVLAAFVVGTSALLLSLAYRTVLPSIVPSAQLPDATARMQATEWTARAGGPGIAGLVMQLAGAAGGAVFAAVTALSSLITMAATGPAKLAAPRERPRGILAGARLVLRDPLLRAVTITTALAAFARALTQSVQVVFLVREVGLTAATAGVLLSALGLGGVLGALVTPLLTRRFGTAQGLLVLQAGTAPFALLVPLTGSGPGIALFAVGSLAVGIGLVGSNVITAGWRLTYCQPEILGRVTAAVMTLVNGAAPLGALAGAALAASFGVRPALWAGAVGLSLAALALLLGPVRGVRDLPRRD
ncbi:MFS transporter [Kineosporia babensis]|uniref:MFS transporter n=1 Tax=Kineosporia babensis TaxID=499548 RepID=A0A9X1ND57_9ACTN|nr:MFS transporter [Kineosporia babensis]MCD5311076.1 MFS transporter [Kineosporia babensis]